MSEILTPVSILCDPAETERLMAFNPWLEEPNLCYRCLDCGFVLEGPVMAPWPGDSYRFRAEQHAATEGHTVGFYFDWPTTSEPMEEIR